MVSLRTRVAVWGLAGGRCSFEHHRLRLVLGGDSADPSLIGDVAHIVGESSAGPRGVSGLTQAQRDAEPNLMLLCKNHHKTVDDAPDTYTIDALLKMKAEHLAWVDTQLDDRDRVQSQIVAGYVAEWSDLVDLDSWEDWLSALLSSDPHMTVSRHSRLWELDAWLQKRVWQEELESIQAALRQFERVLGDLLTTFGEHSVDKAGMLWTERFYKIPEWDREAYEALFVEYTQHVALVGDLALELTRAANFVCDEVRLHLDGQYRLDKGALTAVRGPNQDYEYKRLRPEYEGEERSADAYPALVDFRTKRFSRDYHIG